MNCDLQKVTSLFIHICKARVTGSDPKYKKQRQLTPHCLFRSRFRFHDDRPSLSGQDATLPSARKDAATECA